MLSSAAVLLLSLLGVNTIWDIQLPYSPRGESHLVNREGSGQILLVPMGNAGLGGWSGDGTPLPGFPVSVGSGVILRPCAVTDPDGNPLIAYTDNNGFIHLMNLNGIESPGWPLENSENVTTGITGVDLNDNGEYALCFGTSDGVVHLVDLRGRAVQGFPVDLQSQLQFQPTVVSLGGGNGNGLICSTNNSKITVLSPEGTEIPGWPQVTSYPSGTVPVSGDVNGDGQAEIIFASQDGKVHVYSLLGQEQEGWPFFMDDRPVSGSPAIGILDTSLQLPQIAIASIDSTVYLLNGDGSLAGTWRWPNRTDSRPYQPIISDTNFGPAVIAAAHSGTVYAWDASGRRLEGFPLISSGGAACPPVAGDLDGNGSIDLVVISPAGKASAYILGPSSYESCIWPLPLGDQFNSGSFAGRFVPVAEVEQLSGEFSGPVTLSYSVSCADFTGTMVSYSTDAGYSWIETRNYTEVPGRIIWNSQEDLPFMDERSCLIRITPFSNRGPGESGTSDLIHIDNNNPPEIFMESIERLDDSGYRLVYAVEDREGDILQLQGQFSTNGGTTWELMDLDMNSLEIEPWFYGEPVVWNTGGNSSLQNAENIKLRIRAADSDPGPWYYVDGLHIDADSLPTGQIIAPTTKVSGRIVMGVRLSDPEQNPLDVAYEYSTDGENWFPATVIEEESAGTSRYEFQIVWLSGTDLPYFDGSRVRMRALPYDAGIGIAVPSAPFHLDNNSLPSVTIDSPSKYDVFRGAVPIRFSLSDVESDSITLNLEYRFQGTDATWHMAGGLLSTGPFGPGSYSSTLRWNSSVDLPEVSVLNIDIRLVAFDGDSARSEPLGPITLENTSLPEMIRAATASIDRERGQTEIEYEIVDPRNRIISLQIDFSVDSGETWHNASVSGATAGISTGSYNNRFTWNFGSDLMGAKGTTILRITPVFNGSELGRPRFIEQVFR